MQAPYVHYITALWIDGTAGTFLMPGKAPYWRVDACFNGHDDDELRDRAYRWAQPRNEAGQSPIGCVIRLTDGDEAANLYRAKIMTAREAELLGADVIAPAVAA